MKNNDNVATMIREDWRRVIARTSAECLAMGCRHVAVGTTDNPFLLRVMRRRQAFDTGPMAVSQAAAREAGLYVKAPLETEWTWLCGTDDRSIADEISGLLKNLPNRTMRDVEDMAEHQVASRMKEVSALPFAHEQFRAAKQDD